mgnify:CR=1 FL=1
MKNVKEVVASFLIVLTFVIYIFIISPPSFSQEPIFSQYAIITLVLNKEKPVTIYFDSQQMVISNSMTVEVTAPTVTIASSAPFAVNGIHAVYNSSISAYSVTLQVEDYQTLNVDFE